MSSNLRFGQRSITIAVVVVVVGLVIAWFLASGTSGAGRRTASAAQGSDKQFARMIRVNSGQYRQIIQDIFGPSITIEGRFAETEKRSHGLLAIGDAEVSVTAAGFESAEAMAQQIARQVVNENNRGTLIPCVPAAVDKPDDACAQQFFASTGRLLYRRTLTPPEIAERVGLAHEATSKTDGFYNGLATSLASMLTSPEFMFRVERAEPDPDNPGKFRLNAYSKANRLSALLWNSSPDSELLDAAENGKLDTSRGLASEVERMLNSPKLENGTRAFFSDMLEFDKFDTLGKDPAIYPRFTAGIGAEMEEQTLRLIVDELLVKKADYRDLFTTRETFLTPSLAALTDIVLVQGASNGEPDRWVRYEYPQGDPRGGLLAMPAFTALNSHPGKSSPTLRGKALRQNLLCQVVPDPPAGVDFELFNSGKAGPTARERLAAHATVASCAGCHKLIDPVGFALENFDGSGNWRTQENGVNIVASGDLDGVKYNDAIGLAKTVANNPATTSCVVNRVFSYGVGREVTASDRNSLQELRKDFEKEGRRFPDLLRIVATSDEFSQVNAPKRAVAKESVPDTKTLLSQASRGE